MRRKLIAGNWKMNLDRKGAAELAGAVARGATDVAHVDLLVCPPSVYLLEVAAAVVGSDVAVGAQNMYHEGNGAYTGELSAAMLSDCGAKYVILGHSERRHILGESDADIDKKTAAALAARICPIVCVGEKLAERQEGSTQEVIRRQFTGSLASVSAADIVQTVIAYETGLGNRHRTGRQSPAGRRGSR